MELSKLTNDDDEWQKKRRKMDQNVVSLFALQHNIHSVHGYDSNYVHLSISLMTDSVRAYAYQVEIDYAKQIHTYVALIIKRLNRYILTLTN